MEFKITSFQKYNEAVKTLLGYLKEYDKLIDRLVLDKKYYRDEIEQGDYSDEDLKAIIYGNFDKYEIHLLNTVYYMFESDDINFWRNDIDLPIVILKNDNKVMNLYPFYNNRYCYPTRKENYNDRKHFYNETLIKLEIYYNKLYAFENRYKIKD